ncbi:Pycsar system effector family protein [Mangrovimonas sp. ST2L15]|uniref:Pycsar system effector family protein n=1 Tax=Mangrovimonas sp. ST2L15 TaxID=1645916 RepID=UPI0006B69D19|nr:Pycsar system effector family protein [Mangrovimonas sp. ST2L15]
MSQIVKKAEEFVFNLFKENLDQSFLYHNFTHTERVLRSLREIIDGNEDIDKETAKALQLAAILHDTGYTVTRNNHEEESVKIAKNFLKEENADDSIIEKVSQCILATKMSDEPKSQIEKIIRDADSSHFGKEYFEEASEFLRKELEIQGIAQHSSGDWLNENIKMLSTKHEFYTDYALKNWQPQKEKNLGKLIKTKNKLKKKRKKEEMKAKMKAKYKNASPERGIQTFYRVALRNHIKLSDIADTKANILLSVNAIIISLVLSNLMSKLDSPSNAYLIIPTAIFLVSSIISMVLSIIATRPNITRGEFTKEDVENKEVNLTFFGNFHKMKLDEYEWAVDELLQDKEYVYKSLTKDLYFLGKVLDRKYRILRMTYTFFMAGMIISVIAFMISFHKNGKKDLDDVISYHQEQTVIHKEIKDYDLMVSIKSS